MTLIDADALIKKLDPEYKATVKLIKSGETHLDTLAEGYTEVHDLIMHEKLFFAKDIPEEKHGHWEEVEIQLTWCIDDVDIIYKCSNCGENSDYTTHYCPHCGAKMDEVE